MSVIFQLDQQSLQYGAEQVLDGVSLTVNAGEKVALLGPSGAGKTSLLNLLYQQQTEGVAWCPQQQGLVDILSVYHNIYMGQLEAHSSLYNAWNLVFPVASHRKTITQLCLQLGIEHKLFHSVDRLSGGQRQRVAIGRALYRQQAIFLGDEPVSSLDPVQAQEVLGCILERHDTAVVALHNSQQAIRCFDRLIGLKAGRVCFDLPASQVSESQLQSLYQGEPGL
jgi:phosphonate transport system ATP-binding protein